LIRASINLREKLFRRRWITEGKSGDDDRVAQDFIARQDIIARRDFIRSEDVAAVRRQYECCDTPM
jgi:hypothetical protein